MLLRSIFGGKKKDVKEQNEHGGRLTDKLRGSRALVKYRSLKCGHVYTSKNRNCNFICMAKAPEERLIVPRKLSSTRNRGRITHEARVLGQKTLNIDQLKREAAL